MTDNNEAQIYNNRYKIEKKLGAGNFGTAYLVTDNKTRKKDSKVLKVVRLGEMDPEESVDSVREAELLAKLDNEYIVKFYESFLENDCLCIVTEFCEGGDLDQRLKEMKKQNRSLEEDQIVEWLIQILIAVQYMHKSRILHRDLKARNIFLKSDQIKIGDFGISRILVGTMDVATTFTGTPYYMSPEVMKHDGYEAKSDIWSVGCLLYEMCTYQHAFDGKGLMNVIYKVVEGKTPELPKTYSKELNDVLKKMFIKDPKKRPSAADVLQSPFISRHRERTNLTGALENTISGNARSRDINTRMQVPISFAQMQKQSWSISSKDNVIDEDDLEHANTVPSNQPLDEEDEAEEEEQTMKAAKTYKSTAIRKTLEEEDPREQRFNNPRNDGPSARNLPARGGFDDRPITPMRGTYNQIADRFGDEEDPRNYGNRSNHQNTNRTREANERTMTNSRVMSASQSAMNSMSRTIGAHRPSKQQQEIKTMSPARTIGSATGRKPPMTASIDDSSATLRDNPNHDAFGPKAREMKINSLRVRAIQKLGESTFEKVYDYYVKQRTAQKSDPDLDEAKITHGLRSIVKNPGDCFFVDQLVFLELMS